MSIAPDQALRASRSAKLPSAEKQTAEGSAPTAERTVNRQARHGGVDPGPWLENDQNPAATLRSQPFRLFGATISWSEDHLQYEDYLSLGLWRRPKAPLAFGWRRGSSEECVSHGP